MSWQEVWGEPEWGEWDIDDLQQADDWPMVESWLEDAFDQHAETGHVDPDLVEYINEWLEDHDIDPGDWWAELYG